MDIKLNDEEVLAGLLNQLEKLEQIRKLFHRLQGAGIISAAIEYEKKKGSPDARALQQLEKAHAIIGVEEQNITPPVRALIQDVENIRCFYNAVETLLTKYRTSDCWRNHEDLLYQVTRMILYR